MHHVFNMGMRIKNFIKHRRWSVVIGAIILLGIGGYKFLGSNSNTDKDFVTVRKGDVRQAVNVTGRVKAAQNVDLAFEKAGRVVSVFSDVGTVVVPGQSLVALSVLIPLFSLTAVNQYLFQHHKWKFPCFLLSLDWKYSFQRQEYQIE